MPLKCTSMIEKITFQEVFSTLEENSFMNKHLGLALDGSVILSDRYEFRPKSFIFNEGASYADINRFRYAILKNIGLNMDSTNCVLLIAGKGNNDKTNFKGIIGDMIILRGSNSYASRFDRFHITAYYVYDKFVSNLDMMKENTDIRIGRFVYNGEEFCGVYIKSSMASYINFSGIYSTDCLFTVVKYDDVTEVEET